ncbi:ChuX/HutX family heme-like substrate-binding protein [Candidatus Fukatsuia symbiotica]|uniref:Hemin-degrading factor n=1 Tax=Candidatus Fukatsuia symbiotica TaxID=1878942 RepID=A0A2U8I3A9_9GAMM|nr:ChuX/HutX family heme-like substrate-binding protein [Candidatus Fukatsuia symbiotica]AWK13593.1 hemin-degrading factor [Candidatus Fukatsuia symbiotica]MEA9445391.1 ChuX/HutX family heme-like substrate-binding protein [Candidatus Fukatsuia symbiotica]
MESSLYQQYLQAKQNNPHLLTRDIANMLKVKEVELTHSRVGYDAQRLQVDALTLLTKLETVGFVKSVTANQYAIHQLIGRYQNQKFTAHGGLILNPRELDLRLFLAKWDSIFSVREYDETQGEQHSIHFYDLQGNAAHEVYPMNETDQLNWQSLIKEYASDDNPELVLQPVLAPREDTDNNLLINNAAQIEDEWRKMTDIHQFFRLLERYNATRQQLFRVVADDLAYQVNNSALTQILNAAHQNQNEVMIFVSNGACVQIFTGLIEQSVLLQETTKDNWIKVDNRRFTLQLNESAIAESWITRKPTRDGFVTSLELFSTEGIQIAQLFGQRTEGQPEQNQWREQLAALAVKKDVAV